MVSFIGIPGLRAPDNMNLDFAPLGNALDSYFKQRKLSQGTSSLADALGGNALSAPSSPTSPMQATRSNALSSTLSSGGMGPPDAMSYGVAGGAKNAMFDMGNLSGQHSNNLDPDLVNRVKQFEGYTPKAQWDYKQNSNGYGTRAQFPGEQIDQATANQRLNGELGKAQSLVEQHAPNAPDGWKKALTDLTYNAGDGWARSGLGVAVKNGEYDKARDLFVQYNKAGGQTLPGLVDRRRSDMQMAYDSGSANSSPQAQQTAPQPYRTADASGGIDPRILNWVKENPAHPAAQEILGKILEQRTDPMSGLRMQQAQANLKGTLSEQDRAGVEHFGKISAAIDELPPGPQRDGAWARIITQHNAQHPGEHLTQQELDPITGPKLMAAQAGNLAAPDKFTTVGHDAFGSPSYGFVNDRTQKITLAQVPGQQSTDPGTGPHITGEDFLKTIDKPIADQVRAIAEGRMPIPGGFALKTPYWQKMMQNVAQYDPSFDAINYNARAATRKDFTSGKSAQNITSFNTAIGHLDSLDKSIVGLDNGNYPLLNEYLINPVKSQISPEYQIGVQKFQTSRLAVAEELARAFKGTGGSLSEVEHWNGLISSAKTPDQLHAAVKQAVDLLESRINAVGEGYRRGMGSTADVKDLLNPKARAALQRLNGDAASPSAGDAPVQVSSPDEALKLAPGTVFMTPDGRTKVRP